jgi:hypothetical protein
MNKIKSFIVFTFIISTFFTVSSQNLDKLDERFGFQNFKFNTPLSNYNQYNPTKIADGQYSLKNLEKLSIGNYPIESLDLYFTSNNLSKVKVTLDDQDRQKNENIFNALINNYGRYTFHRSTSGYTYTSEMIWKGKIVNLVYSFTSFRDGNLFQTKIVLIYSYIGDAIEVDIGKDL